MKTALPFALVACGMAAALLAACVNEAATHTSSEPEAPTGPSFRQRVSINDNWRFTKGDPSDLGKDLTQIQIRTTIAAGAGGGGGGGRGGGGPPANTPMPNIDLVRMIQSTSSDWVKDPMKRIGRGDDIFLDGISYTSPTFDDSAWKRLDLPHDWAIEGPFVPPNSPNTAQANGGTGRLPYFGQAWYRKNLSIPAADQGKQFFLDVDGAMAYAIVFLNGKFVGGWPYGYASWRLDLTPYLMPGGTNVLSIRLDNPPNSSRWYPGGGIYRNVWLVKTSPVHVGQWGTFVTTPQVSAAAATVNMDVTVDNNGYQDAPVTVTTTLYALNAQGAREGGPLAVANAASPVPAGKHAVVKHTFQVTNPRLWSPKMPNRYVAVTTVAQLGKIIDSYETPFGIRTITYEPSGLKINGEAYKMNGVCDHHDLGALGTAFNYRAAQRQLEILRDMGCNAIRTTHNPPAPELLDLADQMGFLVMDETFDTWRNPKTPNDYARIFTDWHEQDTRALVHRDRNHPSVIMWSVGNEVGEQGQGAAGAAVAQELTTIVHEEDPTRPTTSAQNEASPTSPFPAAIDALGMNYQGSRPNPPRYPNGNYEAFKENFPTKFIYGSETSSTISSRGEYTFPVPGGKGAITSARSGQDVQNHQMSSYDLSYPSWATSPDTEFSAQDHFPYVGGEFVWTGFDYLGEPTPWGANNDPARSSYFGIIDLAGFPKDRFYLYQAHWRPDFPMAHILPHWNWPDRVGQVIPVHVYTSGDEAELFLNGQSMGRKKKGAFEYRIRWDDVVYAPGELRVVAYKDGKQWATETVKTTGAANKLLLQPDRATIAADGHDLSFVKLTVADTAGLMVPRSKNPVHFTISGPGEIVATDNGDPTDLNAFPSHDRKAFNGLAMAIIKAKRGAPGTIIVTAKSDGLSDATTKITTQQPPHTP